MKFSKKQEKEVLKVYEAFFHSYLNGDVKNYASYLDDDFHFVGTVAEEEFLNKKDAVKFFEKTADRYLKIKEEIGQDMLLSPTIMWRETPTVQSQ